MGVVREEDKTEPSPNHCHPRVAVGMPKLHLPEERHQRLNTVGEETNCARTTFPVSKQIGT